MDRDAFLNTGLRRGRDQQLKYRKVGVSWDSEPARVWRAGSQPESTATTPSSVFRSGAIPEAEPKGLAASRTEPGPEN